MRNLLGETREVHVLAVTKEEQIKLRENKMTTMIKIYMINLAALNTYIEC